LLLLQVLVHNNNLIFNPTFINEVLA